MGDECKAARFGVDRPRLHLAPSPTVHPDKEDSLFCSFVALKIIILLWHIGRCIDVNALMVLRKIFNFLTQQQVLLTKTPLSIGHIYLSITSTVRGFFLRAAFRGPRPGILAQTSAFWLLDTFSPRTSSLALQPPPMIQAMDRLAFQSTAIRIHSGHFWPGKT